MRILSERRAIMGARIGRAAVAAAVLSMAALVALPAAAEGLNVPSDIRANMGDRLDVKLTGRLDARCLLSGGGDIDLGELRGGEGVMARFGLECNVPFEIDIRSAHGGLAHATKPQGEGPFSGLLEYDLNLTVPVLRPTPGVVRGAFGSRQLLTHATLSSGDGIAAGGGSLELRTRATEGAGLLAGRYSETLSLTVSPRI